MVIAVLLSQYAYELVDDPQGDRLNHESITNGKSGTRLQKMFPLTNPDPTTKHGKKHG
jgi:hypothetical protein